MGKLTATERQRLVGILGRLGSDYGGERAAAGLLASRMLRDRNLTWADLLGERAERLPGNSSSADAYGRSNFATDMQLISRHLRWLTDWEQNFALSMVTVRRPSLKQLTTLQKIATSLRVRGFV